MTVTKSILPAADHLLVEVIEESPFDLAADYKITLIATRPDSLPPVLGRVLAVGPSPFIPDDASDQDESVEVGDIVIFPPTSGFLLPPGRDSQSEHRIMRASVIAGKLKLADSKDAS